MCRLNVMQCLNETRRINRIKIWITVSRFLRCHSLLVCLSLVGSSGSVHPIAHTVWILNSHSHSSHCVLSSSAHRQFALFYRLEWIRCDLCDDRIRNCILSTFYLIDDVSLCIIKMLISQSHWIRFVIEPASGIAQLRIFANYISKVLQEIANEIFH